MSISGCMCSCPVKCKRVVFASAVWLGSSVPHIDYNTSGPQDLLKVRSLGVYYVIQVDQQTRQVLSRAITTQQGALACERLFAGGDSYPELSATRDRRPGKDHHTFCRP